MSSKHQTFGGPAKITYVIETEQYTIECEAFGEVRIYAEDQSQWVDVGMGMMMMNPFLNPPVYTIETDGTLIDNDKGTLGVLRKKENT